MEEKTTRHTNLAARFCRWMFPQGVGLLVFLASMPLNVLNGHGRGMIADPDHFQGWEAAWVFGFVFSSWLIQGDWNAVIFLPIAITTAFTITMPFVDLSNTRVAPKTAGVLKGVGSVSFVLTAIYILQWAIVEGAFWGAIPWLLGPALVVFGAIRQKAPNPTPRCVWSFSLRTLIVMLTAFALPAAAIGAYPDRVGPVVVLAILMAALTLPNLLLASEAVLGQMPDDHRPQI